MPTWRRLIIPRGTGASGETTQRRRQRTKCTLQHKIKRRKCVKFAIHLHMQVDDVIVFLMIPVTIKGSS